MFFREPYYVGVTTLYILGDEKMNIINLATDQEEIDEIKSIVQVFVVSARIKQLATSI